MALELSAAAEPPGWRAWLGPIRPAFLLLSICCVLLGAAVVHWTRGGVDWQRLGLVMAGALLAHAAVNAFNEWADFQNGLDARTTRTPFSGGSGTLPRHPQLAPYALSLAIAALLLCAAIGVYLLWQEGPALLPLGLSGLALVLSYSFWLVQRPWLCLIAPGLGVGPLMVVGTTLALGAPHSAAAWAASLPPFFLGNGLLLLNQFPDLEADRWAGRRNLPIVYGRRVAAGVYLLLLLAAFAALPLAVLAGWLPVPALLGLLSLPLAVFAGRRVWHAPDRIETLLPAMACNVALNLTMPLLLALGLWLS